MASNHDTIRRFKSAPAYFGEPKSISKSESGETIISEIVIVNEGIDKSGELIDRQFMESIVEQGNAADGIKSRFGHPNICKDSLGTFIGKYKNFRIAGNSVVADLHLSDVSKNSPDGNLHDYIVGMATKHPDMFGNSIVFTGTDEPHEMGDEIVPRLILHQFKASDLVDSPCATESLFKSSDDLGVAVTEFFDEHPRAIELIAEKPEIVKSFIERYANYKSKQSKSFNMQLLEKIKSMFGNQKNIDLTDATGKIITIITDAENPAVGDAVEIEGAPAPDGNYPMADGSTIVVSGGKIESIEPKKEDQPATASDGGDQPAENADAMKSEIESMKTKMESMKSELQKMRDQFARQLDDHRKSIEFIGKMVGSKYVPEQPDATGRENAGDSGEKSEARQPMYQPKQK